MTMDRKPNLHAHLLWNYWTDRRMSSLEPRNYWTDVAFSTWVAWYIKHTWA